MVSDEFPAFDGGVEDDPSDDVEERQDGEELVENDDEGKDLLREQVDRQVAFHREGLSRGGKGVDLVQCHH